MGFLSRLWPSEKRSRETVTARDPYLADFFGYGGASVDPVRASGHAVAVACVGCYATNLAAMPLWLYRREPNGGRTIASEHPLTEVLHDRPNPSTTAFEFREAMIAALLTHGNAFARIEWNGRGQAVALQILPNNSVAVERLESGRLRYRVSDVRGGVVNLVQDEVLHLRYRLGRDGIMGVSPLYLARDAVALALAQSDQAQKQASNDFRPTGAFVFDLPLSADQRASLATHASPFASRSQPGVLVLDGGVKWQPFAMTAKDAEFLESRKLSNLDICRIYGVPPSCAGITDNATYSNADQEARALVVRCLAPMARRIEQAMGAALLPAMSRKTMFIEHDLAGLLRGDMAARYEAYRIGREWGWLSPNEIRGWENLPAIDGGDERLSPLNMTTLGNRPATEDAA